MTDAVIQIEKLGKRYRYGGPASLNTNLRADITDWLRGLVRRDGNHHPTLHDVHEEHLDESPEYFWALRDIDLEVRQGEVVGIIGRNGAGKSTLLKILSRITPPTTGKIIYRGHVASLLEVGTGFHRELTGRENIFLNGSILGMKRAEIARKFDEIVAFAEVDKFLDTPVKFYSSGMYVRLAFAVAAHLEPEILVVDEVLAVGDAEFQKKCLGKMGDVAKQGRTILFVSHNMSAIANLCSRAVYLEAGRTEFDGPAESAISEYFQTGLASPQAKPIRSGQVILRLWLSSGHQRMVSKIPTGGEISLHSHINCDGVITKPQFGIGFVDSLGRRVVTFHTLYQYPFPWKIEGETTLILTWPSNFLCPGTYRLVAALFDGDVLMGSWEEFPEIEILPSDYFGTGRLPNPSFQGSALAKGEWTIQSDSRS